MSEEGHKWFSSWLPLAVQAGPFLTVALGFLLCVTTWWLVGNLTDCVDRNRLLTDKMVAQQEAFHRELVACLAHCPPR